MVSLALAAAIILQAPAVAQSFLGEWKATAHSPGVEVSEFLSVTRTDDGYEITVESADPVPEGTPQAGPGVEIQIDGAHFSYKRVLSTSGGEIEITYEGIVSGDTFRGTVDLGFVAAPYAGVRIKNEGAPTSGEDE
jgi:hypothetical protein